MKRHLKNLTKSAVVGLPCLIFPPAWSAYFAFISSYIINQFKPTTPPALSPHAASHSPEEARIKRLLVMESYLDQSRIEPRANMDHEFMINHASRYPDPAVAIDVLLNLDTLVDGYSSEEQRFRLYQLSRFCLIFGADILSSGPRRGIDPNLSNLAFTAAIFFSNRINRSDLESLAYCLAADTYTNLCGFTRCENLLVRAKTVAMQCSNKEVATELQSFADILDIRNALRTGNLSRASEGSARLHSSRVTSDFELLQFEIYKCKVQVACAQPHKSSTSVIDELHYLRECCGSFGTPGQLTSLLPTLAEAYLKSGEKRAAESILDEATDISHRNDFGVRLKSIDRFRRQFGL
jgi:hypothetical protein